MSIQQIDAPAASAPLAPLCRPDARDTLLSRYREVVHAQPDATALVVDGESVTFDLLSHRTYSWARKIATLTAGSGGAIAVEADATADSIVLMLAVIAAGNTLVPLDPRLPDERRDGIIAQAGAMTLTAAEVAAAEESCAPLRTTSADNTAVINYTSGSTGDAKGVVLSHRMCLTKAYEVASALTLGPRDRVGDALPVSFGAGLNTLLAGLLSGAVVHCRDPRAGVASSIADWVQTQSLTTLHCSSSLLRAVAASEPTAAEPRSLPSLRVVTTYGEALHARDVENFRGRYAATATMVNWYATTEAGAVAHNAYPMGRALPDGFLPAGTPTVGKLVQVVRADGAPAATGETGEVLVTASCLAGGYLGRDDLTAERFVSIGDGLTRYRTGDLGKFDATGALHLAGRIDDAVKVRGYLVEPAEVEAALRAVEGIGDTAVFGRTHGTETELVAYVCPAPSGRRPSANDVRRALRSTLPEWMVPKHIVEIDSMPRNERGKVDRRALPEPAERRVERPAASPTEYIVAEAARLAIGLDSIGRDEDFVSLGADSLTSIAMLAELRATLKIELTVADLFETGTVRTLATRVDAHLRDSSARERRSSGGHEVLVPLRTTGTRAPVFLVGGAGVGAMAFQSLIKHIDPAHPVYALQAHGRDRRGRPDRTIARTAARYVRAVREVAPSGPYHLVGHSLGGWIAVAMAQELRALGLGEHRVLILDTRLFRHLLDRLPGGKDVPAAPPAQTREDAGFDLGRLGTAALWVRMQFAGLVRYPMTTEWLVFASIGYVALNKHQPTPWSGPMTVVRTPENVREIRSWRTLATGDLSIVDITGDHVNMLREPMVEELGKIIGDTFAGED